MREEPSLIVRSNAQPVTAYPERRMLVVTPRDFLAIGFRHRWLMGIAFVGTLAGAILATLLIGDKYTSHLRILVRPERIDPVVTIDNAAVRTLSAGEVPDEEINSEIELIGSQDLLEKVVLQCGLLEEGKRHFWSIGRLGTRNPAEDLNVAMRRLRDELGVSRVNKSSLIEVTYTASDPKKAATVLGTLESLYLSKHMAMHQAAGQFEFFKQEADRYHQRLADAETELSDYRQGHDAVAAQADRDLALQKVNELEFALSQTRASIRATRARIEALESQLHSTPPRLSTQAKDADNPLLLQQLKSTLLSLELKRTELLAKYNPTYPPVQEVEAEISQARAAIEHEIKAPLREKTTDQNPTYEWVVGELTKARADLPGLEATESSTQRAVEAYRRRIRELDEKGIVDQDLVRTVKAEEENYLLYRKKEEEARISDQLDRQRISNIVIAQAATAPALPTKSRWLIFLLGIPLGTLVSIGSAFVSDYMAASFRTPDEVKEFLQLPVLAALPEDGQDSDW